MPGLFCRATQESQTHLFFDCSFSRRIWRSIISDCLVSNPPTGWDDVVLWSVAELQGRSLKSCVCKLCFGAAVYHLWLQRNVLLHGKTLRTEEQIVSRIRWKVRTRVLVEFPSRMAQLV